MFHSQGVCITEGLLLELSAWVLITMVNFCNTYQNFTCECFSDTLIEQAAGGSTVAEIFKTYGESFFRDSEVRENFFPIQLVIVML